MVTISSTERNHSSLSITSAHAMSRSSLWFRSGTDPIDSLQVKEGKGNVEMIRRQSIGRLHVTREGLHGFLGQLDLVIAVQISNISRRVHYIVKIFTQ